MMTPFTNKDGMALVLCLLVISVLSLLGGSALLVSSTNQKISANYSKQAQAFNVAEAGVEKAIATIKNSVLWRGDDSPPQTFTGSLGSGSYTVTISDSTDDNNGVYNGLIPAGYVKFESAATYSDSAQTVECFVSLAPDDASTANSPDAAAITTGPNTGSGPHVVNGYDNDGVLNAGFILSNQPALPDVNEDALKAFADYSFSSLGNGETDGLTADGVTDFFKDSPTDTQPHIIHVTGNMDISGDRNLYGIIFVEGDTVTLSGAVRVHGIIYAPYATIRTTINGGGDPGDQPVMGQVICGSGGIYARGNHADVQHVRDYVDAFNNWGGDTVNVTVESWKQS